MCNLYSISPKNDVEVYVRRMVREGLMLPEYDSGKPVGPFGVGLFIHAEGANLKGQLGQWGLIRPGQPERIDYIRPKASPGRKPSAPRPRSTNNARTERIDKKPTFAYAWRKGRRCLVPASWYAEPNWETGKNIWWHLKRADGLPWFLAGLWSEWTDPNTGEIVPNFTILTCNCDGHPLLGRLHKPDPALPPDAQDKRSLIHVDATNWSQWLTGTEEQARALISPQPAQVFEMSDAVTVDAMLAGHGSSGALF